MIGRKLGHYQVVEQLGSGGMGVVYRARDTHLDRDVALKVLTPGVLAGEAARRRFRGEAAALSRLNHPGIATVHDFDVQDGIEFLVMELVPGSSLDRIVEGKPLPEARVLDLGLQLARGLEAAHAQGVIHRDLKPGNAQLTPDGRLKILDFGLAKLRATEAEADADTAELAAVPSTSAAGQVVGSPPYMAPEQVLGEHIDARTDVYGAGTVLYEMATGVRPFAVAAQRLVSAILRDPPRPPHELNPALSKGLSDLILSCLEKDPGQRPGSARELAERLQALAGSDPSTRTGSARIVPPRQSHARTAAAALALALVCGLLGYWLARPRPHIASLVVLPLENRSGDPGQDYFVDGMTDALTNDLAKVESLRVISRTSATQVKAARTPLARIGKELGVDAVVEGSVFRAGDRIRVTAELVEVATDRHLWAESYERDLVDVLRLQDELARAIAGHVKSHLAPEDERRLTRHGAVDPQAHEAYLRGRALAAEQTETAALQALREFERAVERAPDYAPAHAAMADVHVFLASGVGAWAPAAALRKAREHAERALELDPGLSEAHVSQAIARFRLDWDWDGAEAAFRSALDLNPGNPLAREEHGWYLAARGHLDAALVEMRRARSLDPLSPRTAAAVAGVLFYRGDGAAAASELGLLVQKSPEFAVGHYGLGRTWTESGRYPEAIAELRKALELSRDNPAIVADLARALALSGDRDGARRELDHWLQVSAGHFERKEQKAHVLIALGETAAALPLLEQALEERSPGIVWLAVDPRFAPLRAEPAFLRLLERARLRVAG